MLESVLDKGGKAATLGKIIHNPGVVQDFARRGVMVADTPADVPDGYTVVIRSHGVSWAIADEISRLGITSVDATCPNVKRIHKIVSEMSEQGKVIIIAGDKNHPEVIGIAGHTKGQCYIVGDESELNLLIASGKLPKHGVVLVAQTTFDIANWKKFALIFSKYCTNEQIFDTICMATVSRQSEAAQLAVICDVVVIAGGMESSNTAKLADICARECKVIRVENADELNPLDFEGVKTVGLTAGASTPETVIDEIESVLMSIR
jgi:4-hydroxy-3-methylbut-2-enyl diphosphate reductase